MTKAETKRTRRIQKLERKITSRRMRLQFHDLKLRTLQEKLEKLK